MKEPPLLRVEWVDCSLLGNHWQEPEELKAADAPIISIGFRVKEENGFLYLAASWQGDDTHKPFAQPIAIPVRAIVKKRRIGH
jgi:hypothetical protein